MEDQNINNLCKMILDRFQKAFSPQQTKQGRTNAENDIRNMIKIPIFPLALLRIILNVQVNSFLRHQSCIYFKNLVKDYWEILQQPNQQKIVIIQPRIKEMVRKTIFQGLDLNNSRLCVTIAEIAHHDFPENWGDLLGNLLGQFKTAQGEKKYSRIKCISYISEHFSTEDAFLNKLQNFIPVMIQISSNQNFNERIRRRGIITLMNIVKLFEYCLEDEDLRHNCGVLVGKVRQPLINFLCSEISKIRKNLYGEGYRIKLTSFNCLFKLLEILSGDLDPFALKITQSLCQSLQFEFPKYANKYLTTNNYMVTDDEYDSEGSCIALSVIIAENFEVLSTAVTHSFIQDKLNDKILFLICDITLNYMSLTSNQLILWKTHPNEYICDDDNSSSINNLRKMVQFLYREMHYIFEDRFEKALLEAVNKKLRESQQMFQKKNANCYRLREGVIYGIGTIVKKMKLKNFTNFCGLLESLVQFDLSSNVPEYLQSRAMWFIKESLGFQMDLHTNGNFKTFSLSFPQYAVKVFNIMLQKLFSNQSLPLKISSSRTITKFLIVSKEKNFLPNQLVQNMFQKIVGATINLLFKCNDDTNYIPLDSLSRLIKCQSNLVHGELYEKLLDELFKIYLKFRFEHLCYEDVINCFEGLSMSRKTHEYILKSIVPKSVNLLNPQINKELYIYSKIICLLTTIIQRSSPNDIQYLVQNTFLPVFQLVNNSYESEIIQDGIEYFRSLIYLNSDFVRNFQFKNNNNKLYQIILSYLLKLLKLKTDMNGNVVYCYPSSCLLGIGKLITAIFSKYNSILSQLIPQILSSLIQRLIYDKNLNVIQSCLFVFIKLFSVAFVSTSNFLAGFKLTQQQVKISGYDMNNQNTGLALILFLWSQHQKIFRGVYQKKLSIMTMINLLLSKNVLLGKVLVPLTAVPMFRPNEERSYGTRSRSTLKNLFIIYPIRAFIHLVDALDYEIKIAEKKKFKDSIIMKYLVSTKNLEFSNKKNYTDEDYDFFDAIIPEDEVHEDDEDIYEKMEPIYNIDMLEVLFNGIKKIVEGNNQYYTHAMKHINDQKKRKLLMSVVQANVGQSFGQKRGIFSN